MEVYLRKHPLARQIHKSGAQVVLQVQNVRLGAFQSVNLDFSVAVVASVFDALYEPKFPEPGVPTPLEPGAFARTELGVLATNRNLCGTGFFRPKEMYFWG